MEKIVTRYDNYDADLLQVEEAQLRQQLREAQHAIKSKLYAKACEHIQIGKVYRVANDGLALSGRLMKVGGIIVDLVGFPTSLPYDDNRKWVVRVWGRMNGKSAAGDGWTIHSQRVSITRLTPVEDEA